MSRIDFSGNDGKHTIIFVLERSEQGFVKTKGQRSEQGFVKSKQRLPPNTHLLILSL